MAHEQRKSLNPTDVKKRLEDYEQMFQYYTLMRTKNKNKDYEVDYEEWWEVEEEYFTKELEKNLAQHRANEKISKVQVGSLSK